MLLPTSHQTALLLLLLSLTCLGSWPNFLKLADCRFELFYFDFTIGALALAAAAALTLGTFGSELSFNDRIAVAGLRSQAFVITGGFLFNIGNMLLVAAISLVGMAVSVPMAVGVALIVAGATNSQGANLLLTVGGTLFLLGSVVSAAVAARKLNPGKSKSGRARANRATSGTALAVFGGVLIGGSSPLTEAGLWGDLGLGAYAGLLMFCFGLALSTAVFSLFFMNIGIEGGRVTFRTYLRGRASQHALGISGGVVWALGTLAALLAQSVPSPVMPGSPAITLFTQGAALVTLGWGLVAWREFASSKKPSNANRSVALTGALFACGLLLTAYRTQH